MGEEREGLVTSWHSTPTWARETIDGADTQGFSKKVPSLSDKPSPPLDTLHDHVHISNQTKN